MQGETASRSFAAVGIVWLKRFRDRKCWPEGEGFLGFHQSGSQSDIACPQLLPPDVCPDTFNKPPSRSKKAGKFKSCHTPNQKPLAMQGVTKSSEQRDLNSSRSKSCPNENRATDARIRAKRRSNPGAEPSSRAGPGLDARRIRRPEAKPHVLPRRDTAHRRAGG